jgi:hypothetical protein
MAWRPPVLHSWDETSISGSGHFQMRGADGAYNTEMNGKNTLPSSWKIVFTQGFWRTNESASKEFDHSHIEAREQVLHDTYTLTFTSATEFELTLAHSSGSWFGSTDEDFLPEDPDTEDPILYIPKEAWNDATWEDGDTVSWAFGLGEFDLYRDDSKTGEEAEWTLIEETLSTGGSFTRTYTVDGVTYDDFTIERNGWRGVFAAGDEITFEIQDAQTGVAVCGDDIPNDSVFYEEIDYITSLVDYQDKMTVPTTRKTDPYNDLYCPKQFLPTADVKSFPGGLVYDDCSYPEYGKGPVDYMMRSTWIWRQAQNYDDKFNPRDIFPISDSQGHNPEMAGFTIKQEIQNVWYQLWAQWVRESDDQICAEGEYTERRDTEYKDFESVVLEMVDIPREWI